MPLTRRQQGVLISLLGIVWVSPDSLLIRLAEEEQHGDGCVVFYKYLFKFLASSIGIIFLVFKGPCAYLKQVQAAGWHFFAAAILEGTCEAGFTMAVEKTTAANNLVLVSANPLWCALFALVAFRELPALHTQIALAAGFGCILIVFFGAQDDTPSGRESTAGDVLGLCTGIILATYLTVVRHAGKVRPQATLITATPLASLISLTVGFLLAQGRVGSECAAKSGVLGWTYSVVNGAIVMPISLACFAIGPKYILSSEVGLIMLLEVLLGPLFVWLALQEVPSVWTLVGGGLLLVVLAVNETLSLLSDKRSAAIDKSEQSHGSGDTDAIEKKSDLDGTSATLEDRTEHMEQHKHSATVVSV